MVKNDAKIRSAHAALFFPASSIRLYARARESDFDMKGVRNNRVRGATLFIRKPTEEHNILVFASSFPRLSAAACSLQKTHLNN